MLALLFTLASLGWLLNQLRESGWSLRRADRRGIYWSTVGVVLGLTVACRPLLPAMLAALLFGALAAAFLYGLIADRQGWWRV
jgi:hypothetical protein